MAQTRMLCLVGLIAATTACAPLEYGPVSAELKRAYGYSDARASDGVQKVRVVLPESSGAETAYAWWDRRAAEICGHDHYRKTMYRAERPTVYYDSYGGRPGGYVLEGFLYCESAPPAAAPPASPEPTAVSPTEGAAPVTP